MGYQVLATGPAGGGGLPVRVSRSTKNEALIIGLQPNTYYYVRVMAYNSAGPGPESERFIERTFKMRPQKQPTAVQVFGINPGTINDLSPGKTYFLRVLAFSQGGEGKMSSPAWKFQMGDPARFSSSPELSQLSLSLLLACIIPLLVARLF